MLETERLILRKFTMADAPFVFELYTDHAFLRYIGDRGVHSVDDARAYIECGPITSYERHGFGLYVVERRIGGERIGVCGLLKRDTLDAPDLGFAFLPAYWRRGYAREAAAAVLEFGRTGLGLPRILAITSPDNAASIALLAKLGFGLERTMPSLPGDTTGTRVIHVYALGAA